MYVGVYNETGTPPQSNGVSLDFSRNLGLFVPPRTDLKVEVFIPLGITTRLR
jgi:hypothetical protein